MIKINKKDFAGIKSKVGKMLEKYVKKEILTNGDLIDFVEKEFTEREKTIIVTQEFRNRFGKVTDKLSNDKQKEIENNNSMYN